MGALVQNTGHIRELLEFLNSRPWSEEERGNACASMVAAYVLQDEGRGAIKIWIIDLAVKGERAKVQVVATCNPGLEQIAKS